MKMIISLGLCLLALTASGCHKKPTQPPPDDNTPITWPDDMEAAWHPSDTMIIYYKTYVNPDSAYYNGLYAIKPDGTNNRPYLLQGMNNIFGFICEPDWTPDGNWIVFSTGWENDIYKVEYNGNSLKRLTTSGINVYPTWSPDGQKIAFNINYNDTLGNLFIIDKDGAVLKRIR